MKALSTLKTASRKVGGKKASRGVTLIELAIGIVVIGILAVLALRGSSIVGSAKGTVEGQNILDTVTATSSCFSKATDYTALGATEATGTAYAVTNCGKEIANPPATSDGASTITNQFGGLRTIMRTSINSGTNNAITVADPLVPTDVCLQVVQAQWGNFDSITITPTSGVPTVAKATAADVFTPAAVVACKTDSTATITVVRAKN